MNLCIPLFTLSLYGWVKNDTTMNDHDLDMNNALRSSELLVFAQPRSQGFSLLQGKSPGNEVEICSKKNLKRRKYMNSASSVTFGSSGTPLVMTYIPSTSVCKKKIYNR